MALTTSTKKFPVPDKVQLPSLRQPSVLPTSTKKLSPQQGTKTPAQANHDQTDEARNLLRKMATGLYLDPNDRPFTFIVPEPSFHHLEDDRSLAGVPHTEVSYSASRSLLTIYPPQGYIHGMWSKLLHHVAQKEIKKVVPKTLRQRCWIRWKPEVNRNVILWPLRSDLALIVIGNGYSESYDMPPMAFNSSWHIGISEPMKRLHDIKNDCFTNHSQLARVGLMLFDETPRFQPPSTICMDDTVPEWRLVGDCGPLESKEGNRWVRWIGQFKFVVEVWERSSLSETPRLIFRHTFKPGDNNFAIPFFRINQREKDTDPIDVFLTPEYLDALWGEDFTPTCYMKLWRAGRPVFGGDWRAHEWTTRNPLRNRQARLSRTDRRGKTRSSVTVSMEEWRGYWTLWSKWSDSEGKSQQPCSVRTEGLGKK